MEVELQKAAALTFEEMAFMFSAPELEHLDAPAKASASVDFQGPLNGRLMVRATDNLLASLAANILGEDEPPSRKEQLDALGEMANIICGNFLPLVAGTRPLFHISAPVIEDCEDLPSQDPSVRVKLPLDQGVADLLLFLN